MAHAGAHAAAQEAAKKKRQEEEEMTNYSNTDLSNDWEFKIVRSTMERFKSRETIEQVKAEEAMAGWVMVEKFDNGRLRFKRPVSAQKKDNFLPQGYDPYRTTYGPTEGKLVMTIFGVIGLLVGLGALIFFLINP